MPAIWSAIFPGTIAEPIRARSEDRSGRSEAGRAVSCVKRLQATAGDRYHRHADRDVDQAIGPAALESAATIACGVVGSEFQSVATGCIKRGGRRCGSDKLHAFRQGNVRLLNDGASVHEFHRTVRRRPENRPMQRYRDLWPRGCRGNNVVVGYPSRESQGFARCRSIVRGDGNGTLNSWGKRFQGRQAIVCRISGSPGEACKTTRNVWRQSRRDGR